MEQSCRSFVEGCDDDHTQQKYELEFIVKGNSSKEIKKRTVLALRVAAYRIAVGQLETGFHDIQGRDGHVVGEIYFDCYD